MITTTLVEAYLAASVIGTYFVWVQGSTEVPGAPVLPSPSPHAQPQTHNRRDQGTSETQRSKIHTRKLAAAAITS